MWSYYETWLPSTRQLSLHCLGWNSNTCRDKLAELNNAPGCLWGATHPMKAKRVLISQKLVSPSHSHINFCNQRWMLKDLHSSRMQCSIFLLMSLVWKKKKVPRSGISSPYLQHLGLVNLCHKVCLNLCSYCLSLGKCVQQFSFFLKGEFRIWGMQNLVIVCLLCLWWCYPRKRK